MSSTPNIYLNALKHTRIPYKHRAFWQNALLKSESIILKCPVLKGKHQRASTQLLSNDADAEDSWPNNATLKLSDWNKTHLSW